MHTCVCLCTYVCTCAPIRVCMRVLTLLSVTFPRSAAGELMRLQPTQQPACLLGGCSRGRRRAAEVGGAQTKGHPFPGGVMASHAEQCQHPLLPHGMEPLWPWPGGRVTLATLPAQPRWTSVGEEGEVCPLSLGCSTQMLF